MTFVAHTSLRCPLDELPLQLVGGSIGCAHRHSFDLAKQGYVNLLSASDKRSRDPGDSKAMVAARHAFLAAGHYQSVAERLAELTETLLTPDALLVDAGCGEGYYLQQLVQHLVIKRQIIPAIVAYDISKWAMQVAARRFPASWLVASNRHIPLHDHSADVLWSLFGFPVYSSFARVLKPGGLLLELHAAPNHLLELRQLLYPAVQNNSASADAPPIPAGFNLLNSSVLNYRTAPIGRAYLAQLVTMTPHGYRASPAGKAQVAALNSLALTVEVEFRLWQRQ